MCDIDNTVHAALSALGIKTEQGAEDAEESIRWIDIVIQALEKLGGKAALTEIYEECKDLVALFHQGKLGNASIESTI